MISRFRSRRAAGFLAPPLAVAAFAAILITAGHVSLADAQTKHKPKAKSATHTTAGATKAAPLKGLTPSMKPAGMGLPQYVPPQSYSVDLDIHSSNGDMVLKRSISNGRVRTDMNADGQDISMIEMGDDKGTTLTLMPKDKRAIRQSSAAMQDLAKGQVSDTTKSGQAVRPPVDAKIEDLGEETRDGQVLKKMKFTVPEGTTLGWFDKATGAPVRMEGDIKGEKTSIEWKNYKVAPQPEALFEAPKNFEVTDMDEMMSKMKGMGAMGAMGGRSGMAKGMMCGMAQNMGSSLGGNFGGILGSALGGPIGSMAGQYLGGKVGGMIGKKASHIVTH